MVSHLIEFPALTETKREWLFSEYR